MPISEPLKHEPVYMKLVRAKEEEFRQWKNKRMIEKVDKNDFTG
jgi:hypothetical protein